MTEDKFVFAIKIFIISLLAFFLTSCNLSTEKEVTKTAGVTVNEILIGSSSALTGHAGYLGANYMHGAMAYIDEINEQGGVNGRKIKVVSYDDEYDPPKCVANTQKLINEDKVFALFNYVGTPTSIKVIPIVEEAKIPLVGLFTGANDLREPVKKYIFNIRGSYYLETWRAAMHFIEDLGFSKIAVFYQNDAYGLDGLKGTEIALNNYGLEPIATASYARGTLDVEDAAETISKSGAEAVIMVGTYSPSAKFVILCKQKGFYPLFDSVSFVGADEFMKELGDYSEGILISQVVPPPIGFDVLRGALRYRTNLKKYYPQEEPNFVGLEGFLNAKVLVEGLNRAGKELTREKFVEALESLKEYSLGIGSAITYSETDHEGLDYIYFTVVSNGKLKFFADWDEIKGMQGIQEKAPGVTINEILIGSSSALTGHAGYLGTSYLHGALSRINTVNDQGGVNGRKIKVISYDDQYDPPKCVANTQKLINEDKVFALFNYVGTPTSIKVIPIVEEAKIPLVGLFTGAQALREPFRKYIFNIRGSYHQEADLAVEHFIDHLGLSRIAVFYQDDDYGLDGLEGVKIALKKYGLEPIGVGSYTRGTEDVEDAVKKITESSPQAVIMVGTYSPSAKFVKIAKQKNPKLLFHSVSFVGPEKFLEELGESGEDVTVTQVVPTPDETYLLESAKAYTGSLAKYYPGETPSFGGFEGFVNAKVLLEGLRRAGRELTRDKFMESLESMRDYSVGIGASVNFGKEDHQGLELIYFTLIKDGKFHLHSKKDDDYFINKLKE